MKKAFFSALFVFTASSGYLHAQTIKTIKNVGGDFSTFAAAIGFLNSAPAGPYVFNVDPGFTSTEICPAINITWGTAANYVTFKKDGAGTNPKITAAVIPTAVAPATTSEAIITILNADYITFDGIDVQENASNTYYKTTSNYDNQLVEYGYLIRNSSGASIGAQHDTIRNCTISLSNTNFSSIGIYQNASSTPGSSAETNSYNGYRNVKVNIAYIGILLKGNSLYPDISCTVDSCTIGTATVGNIGFRVNLGVNNPGYVTGIDVSNQNSLTVNACEVLNVQAFPGGSQSYVVSGLNLNTMTGTSVISNNKIHDIYNAINNSGSTIQAIVVKGGGGTVYVYNNFVYSLYRTVSSTSNVDAIGIQTSGTGTAGLYHNSISLTSTISTASAAMYLSGMTVNIVNNIIKNASVSAGNVHYGVYNSATLGTVNYNNYDVAGTSTNPIGYSGGVRATLTAWRGITSQDVNSSQFTTSFVSTNDLHLNLLACANDPAYQGTVIVTPAISNDIDGDLRVYPYIGADEVNFSSPNVLISANQPVTNTVSKNDVNQLLFGMYLTSYGGSTNFTGITLTTGSTGLGYTAGSVDFKNFTLWCDSTSTTFNIASAFQLGNTITNAPASGGNLQFTSGTMLPFRLSACKPYSFFVTFDVGINTGPIGGQATSGHNINVIDLDTAAIGISTGRKFGLPFVPASGLQYIADRYYNFVGQDITREDSWYDATSLQQPNDFTSNYQLFQMITNPVDTMAKAWGISGVQSKLLIGKADGSVNVLFKADSTYSGIVDVYNNGTFKFQTQNTALTTLGILTIGSTVEYGEQRITPMYQNIIAANYYNLKLSGSTSGTRTFPAGTAGVAGVFTPGGFTTANAGTVSFNGTAVQDIPTFNYNILNINNSTATALSVATGLETGRAIVNTGSTISASSYTITTGNLLVKGSINNSLISTTVFAASVTNSNLGFANGSNYNLTAINNGQIPPAIWNANANANVTGYTATATNVIAGAPGAAGFGNLLFANPLQASAGSKLFNSFGSPITIQGNLSLGHNGLSATPQQMTTGTQTINVGGNVYVYGGNYGLMTYGNTANLNVAGSFYIDATNVATPATGAIFTMASNGSAIGNINVKGNFIMTSGAYTASLVQSSGTANLVFNSPTNHQMIRFATTTGTINLEMNSNANGAKLYSPVTIAGILRLNNGHLSTDATNLLTLTGSFMGGNNNSFINGPLARTVAVTTEYEFPVGDSATITNRYRPCSVSPTILPSGTETFRAQYFPVSYSTNILGAFLNGIQNREYWMINKTSAGSPTARIKLNYITTPVAGNWFPTTLPYYNQNVAVAKYYSASSAWYLAGELEGAVSNYNFATSGPIIEARWWEDATGVLWSKPLTVFSPFGFGYGNNLLLPMSMLSFTGKPVGSENLLEWKTANEVGVKEFVLEKSMDGNVFQPAGVVTARNGSSSNSYSFTDKFVPQSGAVYYRLKTVNTNNENKYGNVLTINRNKLQGIQLFPNPVKDNLYIMHERAGKGSSIFITTINGSRIGIYPVNEESMQTAINISTLSPAIYIVNYEDNGEKYMARFCKL